MLEELLVMRVTRHTNPATLTVFYVSDDGTSTGWNSKFGAKVKTVSMFADLPADEHRAKLAQLGWVTNEA